MRIWDVRETAEVTSFDVGDGVLGLQWARDGQALVVGTKDGGVGMWDVVRGVRSRDDERPEEWLTLGTMRQGQSWSKNA